MLGRTGKQFLRYYVLFFLCLILLFTPFYYISYSLISRNYILNAAEMLITGLANFESDLAYLEEISRNAYNSNRFRRFSYIGSDLEIIDYYYTINLADEFRRYFATSGIIVDCGIVFSNDMVLTTKRLHFSSNEFYNRYFMQSNIPEYDQWVAELLANSETYSASVCLVPLASFVTWESSYEAITYVQRFSFYPERISFFFATMEKDYILSRLATHEVLREGRVVMYDPAGAIFLDSSPEGTEAKNNSIPIEITGEKRGIRVIVDIPQRVFTDKLAFFRQIAFVFSLAYIAVGVVLSVIFAQRSAKPIREIMEGALDYRGRDPAAEDPAKYKTDYKYIEHFISQAKWDYETFETKLKQQGELQKENLFERLLYSLVYSQETYESAKNIIPDFPKKFRIAAVALPKMEEAAFAAHALQQTMIRDLFESCIPQGGYAHFSGSTLVLFLPDEGQDGLMERLRRIAADLRDKMNITGKIAVSETVEDIRETYNTFYRIQQLLRLPHNNTEAEIILVDKKTPFAFPIEFLDATRLYEILLHADDEKALALINSIYYELCKREYIEENDIQQIFFLYRRVLIQIVNDLELDIEQETAIPDYDSRQDVSALFAKITDSIKKICTVIKSRHDEQNAKFEQSVIKFIDDNITNPNLYTKMVTGQFNIIEFRLQNIVRQWTGKSFLEYVESKRLALSREMLTKTSKSITQISYECGYSSDNSFYKAFKRYYDQSPSELRRGNH